MTKIISKKDLLRSASHEELIRLGKEVERRMEEGETVAQESTTQAERVSPINNALHAVSLEISDAFDRLGRLENKLISVIPDGALKLLEDECDVEDPRETASPLTHELREQYRRLIVLNAKLDQLYHAIEL